MEEAKDRREEGEGKEPAGQDQWGLAMLQKQRAPQETTASCQACQKTLGRKLGQTAVKSPQLRRPAGDKMKRDPVWAAPG